MGVTEGDLQVYLTKDQPPPSNLVVYIVQYSAVP